MLISRQFRTETPMKMRHLLALVLLMPAVALANAPKRVHLHSPFIDRMHLPISSGVVAGNTLYIAGTTGVKPGASLSASEEARIIMNRIEDVVRRAGMTMDDIVSIQVFCSDMSAYGDFNKVYRTYFHGEYPARTFVGVAKLGGGARFEVKGIAVGR
jgi:2-iminobutanoate/2-iminopropanoate deaminase